MSNAQDAYELLRSMRMNLTQLQAQVTDLTNILNELHLKDVKRPECRHCGLTFKNSMMRDEHHYLSHDGDVPPHWLAAEQLAETTTTTPNPL